MKKNLWLTLTVILFILSLVPLYLIAGYDHPSADDYYYAVETGRIWNSTHSFTAVVAESFQLMKETYVGWQGNFAAIFLMRLQPGLFGENLYALAPVLLITSFVAAMLFFFVSFFRKWLQAGPRSSWGLALVITFAALQFTYKPSDSFYWYNGSIYYTFFFSLMLTLFGIVTHILHTKKPGAVMVNSLLGILLAFIIGGGNFSTSLFTILILATVLVAYLIVHRKDEDKTLITIRSLVLGFILIAEGISLAIAILAPGNAVRQAGVGGHTGLLKTFLYSFAYGGYNIAGSTTFPVAIMWLALCPLFYRLARRTRFSFRYPLLVLIFTYALFCSQGTAVFYAQGLRIPYRMMNIIYFSYYPFMAFNLLYLMGWLARKFPKTEVIERIYSLPKLRRGVIVTALLLFVVGCVGRISVSETETGSGQASFTNLPLSASATLSLLNGEAAEYDAEYKERVEILENATSDEVAVEPFSVTPDPIFHADITEDPTDWRNSHTEMYFGIESVYLEAE